MAFYTFLIPSMRATCLARLILLGDNNIYYCCY